MKMKSQKQKKAAKAAVAAMAAPTSRKRVRRDVPHMTFHMVTLFPDAFSSYIGESIVKRAIEDGSIAVKFYNPRDFSIHTKSTLSRAASTKGAAAQNDKKNHKGNAAQALTFSERRVDDKPYGGGPGMVMEALPVIHAINAAVGTKLARAASRKKVRLVFLYPDAPQFTAAQGAAFSEEGSTDVVIVCGRYEGIDERAHDFFAKKYPTCVMRLSVGPFVLTGGELAALLIMDVTARFVPGVLGNTTSLEESRAASPAVYTRPESFTYKGVHLDVPKVLLSGNHKEIDAWRAAKRQLRS